MAPSRGLQTLFRSKPFICQQCRSQAFTTAATFRSGHSRWSKIKHDKGKNDAAKNRRRSVFAQEIALASKMYGPDPNSNPRLMDVITNAKREGFAKASIESAIARGQGRSLSGASLESVTVEGILPNNVAVIVECETDNRLRTLADVRLVLKDAGGSATPSAYLFEKRGRLSFEQKDGLGVEEALNAALEAGVIDVEEDEDGKIVAFCEPGDTKAVAEAMTAALNLQVQSSEIIWVPNEDTKVGVGSEDAAEGLSGFVDELREKESSVQAVAMNVAQGSLAVDSWRELQSRLSI